MWTRDGSRRRTAGPFRVFRVVNRAGFFMVFQLWWSQCSTKAMINAPNLCYHSSDNGVGGIFTRLTENPPICQWKPGLPYRVTLPRVLRDDPLAS
jgi:hypothetical protein